MLGVTPVDQDESGTEGDHRVGAEHDEPGPRSEHARFVAKSEDLAAGVHREVGAGILVLGKVVPFGIGAVIGGTANGLFSQGIITASNRAFGAPSQSWEV
jgi:hypothetical protein